MKRLSAASDVDLEAVDFAIKNIMEASTLPDEAKFSRYAKDHRNRLAVDLGLVRKSNRHRILEIGARPWILTVSMKLEGFPVDAIDWEPTRLCGIDIAGCNIEVEVFPFEDDVFDLVLCNEVFEHLHTDLVFAARQVLRVMRPGGELHLSTPNIRSLRGLKALLVDGHGAWCLPDVYDNWVRVHDGGSAGHVREYTSKDVVEFLEKIGFENCETIYRGGGGTRLGWLLLKLFPAWSPYFTVVARKPLASGPASGP